MNPDMMGQADPRGTVIPPTLNLKLFQQEGDQLDYSMYDRLLLNNAGGAIERSFFEVGLGFTDPVSARRKTLADTNLREGRIPEGQAFAGFVLKFYMENIANMAETLYLSYITWLAEAVIQIRIDTKQEYGTWKLSELLGIPNNALIVPAAAGSNATLLAQGMFQSLKPLNLYIPFPRLSSWTIALIQGVAPAAGLDGLRANCSIVGIKNRAG